MIAPDDRGLTLGDGLFETLLARDARLADLEAHLDRLASGCAVLGLPAPDRAEATRLMDQAMAAAGLQNGLAAVRLTLTAGSGGRGLDRPAALRPRLFATASPYVRPAQPATLSTAIIRRNADSPLSRLKSLNYLDNVLAREAARHVGADEALMLNTRGDIACATAANIFWVSGGRVFTPALACGVLAGVARGRVIAAAESKGAPVIEVHAPPAVLEAAQAMFLTNSLTGVREVRGLDGRAFAPSPLVRTLGDLLR